MLNRTASYQRSKTKMYDLNRRLVLVLLVAVALVHGYRRGGDRRRYNQVSRPMSSRELLRNLKSQLYSCTGMFFCGIRSVDNKCYVECVGEDRICNGATDCFNGRDETNCSSQTCPPCPVETPGPECPVVTSCPEETPCPEQTSCPEETPCPDMTPCPEQTPCPSSECPNGQIRCGDGSSCKVVAEICDGIDSCPDGDYVDETVLNCNPDRCVVFESPDACGSNPLPAGALTVAQPMTVSQCRALCSMFELCEVYIVSGSFECRLYDAYPTIARENCDTASADFELYFCLS